MSGTSGSLGAMDALRYKNRGNAALLALIPNRPMRILDVGCGAGDNARILRERGHRVWGVTVSQTEADSARENLDGVWVGDVERMELPEIEAPFDALVMSHILEHLVDPRHALMRLAALLRADGLLFAAVPNMAHWRIRARILRGNWEREDTGPFDRTHVHFWSYETARDLLHGTPFDAVTRIGADASVPLKPLRRVAPRAAQRIDSWLGERGPNLFAGQVLVIGRKRRAATSLPA